MEWKEYQIQDVCRLINGRAYSNDEMLEHGKYKIVRVGNLSGGNSTWFYSDLELPADKYCHNGDLLFAWACTFGPHIWKEDNTIFHYHIWKIVEDKDVVDRRFFYYYLKFATGGFLGALNGSVMVHITKSSMEKMIIRIPKKLEDQRRIASILSSLDRKIELNNKINADLEEMAQAIFKNWFVDFEPFKDGKFVDSELGMIPEGWKVISLSEIMKYNGGSQPPASEFIDTYQEGYIRFIQIRDYDNDSHITYIPISKRNKLCDELDIMIARYGAALGRICWGLKGAYNVALAKVTPIKSYYREYLRCYLNTSYFYQSINNKGARCAQSGFNQSDINSYMIAFPIDETVVMNFNDLCSSIMDKRLSLKYENSRLSLLRDTLLPRLMSGELEVPE